MRSTQTLTLVTSAHSYVANWQLIAIITTLSHSERQGLQVLGVYLLQKLGIMPLRAMFSYQKHPHGICATRVLRAGCSCVNQWPLAPCAAHIMTKHGNIRKNSRDRYGQLLHHFHITYSNQASLLPFIPQSMHKPIDPISLKFPLL